VQEKAVPRLTAAEERPRGDEDAQIARRNAPDSKMKNEKEDAGVASKTKTGVPADVVVVTAATRKLEQQVVSVAVAVARKTTPGVSAGAVVVTAPTRKREQEAAAVASETKEDASRAVGVILRKNEKVYTCTYMYICVYTL